MLQKHSIVRFKPLVCDWLIQGHICKITWILLPTNRNCHWRLESGEGWSLPLARFGWTLMTVFQAEETTFPQRSAWIIRLPAASFLGCPAIFQRSWFRTFIFVDNKILEKNWMIKYQGRLCGVCNWTFPVVNFHDAGKSGFLIEPALSWEFSGWLNLSYSNIPRCLSRNLRAQLARNTSTVDGPSDHKTPLDWLQAWTVYWKTSYSDHQYHLTEKVAFEFIKDTGFRWVFENGGVSCGMSC